MVIYQKFELGSLGTNCYVFYDENKNCVVIDCDDFDKTDQFLMQNKLIPTHILLSHSHFDHTGGVEMLREKYGCKICIGENEGELLENSKLNLSSMVDDARGIKADIFLKDGEMLEVGEMKFQVLETPGHTKGGVCYLIENYLIAGDTLFLENCGRIDFPTGDWGQMKASLQRLAKLEGDLIVLSGHGDSSTLNHERKCNPYMRG